MRRDIDGSEGIGAMIVFVALVLIASVVSMLMIKTGEVLVEESRTDAENDQKAIYGRLFIADIVLTEITFDANNDPDSAILLLIVELSPGTGLIDDDEIRWSVLCPNEANENAARYSNEGDFESVTNASGDGGEIDAVSQMEPGITYMVAINLYHDADSGCPPNYLETHTLAISVGGAGAATTWDLRYGDQLETGMRII